ncbi:MAG: hypothetical protein H0U75_01820 [Legionella sp.]|nr:hypothetical protein [Legionella sp.]
MKWILLFGIPVLLSACAKDQVLYRQVTVTPVCELIACDPHHTLDVTETVLDHY